MDRFRRCRSRRRSGADAQQRVDPLRSQQVGIGEGLVRRFSQRRQGADQQVRRRFRRRCAGTVRHRSRYPAATAPPPASSLKLTLNGMSISSNDLVSSSSISRSRKAPDRRGSYEVERGLERRPATSQFPQFGHRQGRFGSKAASFVDARARSSQLQRRFSLRRNGRVFRKVRGPGCCPGRLACRSSPAR